jgi:hypothetical protein
MAAGTMRIKSPSRRPRAQRRRLGRGKDQGAEHYARDQRQDSRQRARLATLTPALGVTYFPE